MLTRHIFPPLPIGGNTLKQKKTNGKTNLSLADPKGEKNRPMSKTDLIIIIEDYDL